MIKEVFTQYEDKIKFFSIGLGLLVIVYSLFGIYKVGDNVENNAIVSDISALNNFRFLEYRETSEGAFFDIVNVSNGKKYKNIFISRSCPQGKTKKAGMIMKLSVQKHTNYSTKETFYMFDRAYDYMCTKKDMEKEDEVLLKKMQEHRENMLKQVIKDNEQNIPKGVLVTPKN